MKNLLETLSAVVNECRHFNEESDSQVIYRLKGMLALQSHDDSYQLWMDKVVYEVARGNAA